MNRKKKERKTMKTKTKQTTRTEQNQRNGHHMEGFLWGGGGRNSGEKVQGRRSIIGRH